MMGAILVAGCARRAPEETKRAPSDVAPRATAAAASSEADPARDAPCLLERDGHGPIGSAPLRVDVVAKGLEVPWGIAFLPSGDTLVTERPGRVRRVSKDGALGEVVAELDVAEAAEGGLLGIALDPDFASDRAFYLYVTVSQGGGVENQVERWVLDADGRRARRDRVIFGGIAAAPFHDGGRIRFGPDGMLYVGTGDGRRPERSRARSSPNGKILRHTRDGTIPGDNPFAGSAAFVIGTRNVEAFDWIDPRTLAIADHGPSGEINGWRGHDEIDVARAGDDLGWPAVHGCDEAKGAVTPSLAWEEAVPPGGGAVYTGTSIPSFRGAFVVGSLKAENLQVIHFDAQAPGRVTSHEVYLDGPSGHGRLREVVMAPDHQLYVTTSNCDGRGTCGADRDRILRITGG
jgi:glucose/arabinose dehydrogenase